MSWSHLYCGRKRLWQSKTWSTSSSKFPSQRYAHAPHKFLYLFIFLWLGVSDKTLRWTVRAHTGQDFVSTECGSWNEWPVCLSANSERSTHKLAIGHRYAVMHAWVCGSMTVQRLSFFFLLSGPITKKREKRSKLRSGQFKKNKRKVVCQSTPTALRCHTYQRNWRGLCGKRMLGVVFVRP
jgi:hypothetical protein